MVVAPLLKSFQNEIDSLSKRSKSGEKAFFDIYKKFCDIADPVPTLEYCMESMKSLAKMQDMEIETAQLRETLAEYNVEMADLKTKSRRLEEVEVKLEEYQKTMEESIDSEIKAKEEQLNKNFETRVKGLEEEAARTCQRLGEEERKNKGLQQQLDQTQEELFEARSQQEQRRSAITDDMELLLTDLERANQRALTAEKEVVLLQEQLQEAKEQGQERQEEGEQGEEAGQLRVVLQAKEQEVARLLEDLQRVSRSGQEQESRQARRQQELEVALEEVEGARSGLEVKLGQQSDYASIKKDLAILKSLEFPSVESEDDSRPLEVLILERSKGLQVLLLRLGFYYIPYFLSPITSYLLLPLSQRTLC